MAKKPVAQKTEETAAPKETVAKAPAEKKPVAVKAEKRNGVTRPKAGTKTGRVWEVSDSVSKKNGAPAERASVMAICKGEGMNKATVATQYGKWRKFNGLTGMRDMKKAAPVENAPPVPAAKEAPAAPPAE